MKLTFALLLCLSLPISAVANSAAAQALLLEKSNCKSEPGQKALYGAECGYLSLAENPNGKSERQLDIYIMRLPSIRDSNKPPIFFIAGGPGQAATEHANNFRHMLKKLQVEHDFIFVDQRGTGKSNPLDCNFDPSTNAALPPKQIEAKAIEAHKLCLKNYDADLTRYTTPYAVKDLEAVRKALSYERVMLWGGSYGTRVILEYLRSYPDVLTGVILDGIAPITLQIPFNAERDASLALATMLDNCASQASCNTAFPNLTSRWQTLLQELKENPVPHLMQHPRTEIDENVYVDDIVISAWARFILYSREISPILPLAIDEATHGDFSTLYTVASLSSHKIMDQISEGMQLAVLCAEDWQYHQQHKIPSTDYKRLIHMPAPEEAAPTCDLFPKSKLPDNYFSPVTTDVPTLLLSGQYDPVTPPSWGQEVKAGLTKVKHIVAPGGHHIISGSGCIPKLIAEFVNAPLQVEQIDSECVHKIRPSHYFIDKAGPSLSAPKGLSAKKTSQEAALEKIAHTKSKEGGSE